MIERRISFWVGLVVLGFLTGLVFLYGFLSQVFLKQNTYLVHVLFDNSYGILPGAEVRLSGVPVGQVENVSLEPDQRARLTLRVGKEHDLFSDYAFSISQGLLIGEKVVNIEAPPGHHPKGTLLSKQSPDLVEGMETPGVERVIGKVSSLVDKLHLTVNSLHSLIGDVTVRSGVQSTIASISTAAENIREITGEVKSAVAAGRGEFEGILKKINSVVDDMSQLLARTKEVVTEGISKEDLKQLTTSVKASAASLEEMSLHLKQLVTDQQMSADIKQTVSNVKDVSHQAKQLGSKVDSILTRVERAQTSFGKGIGSARASFDFVKYLEEGHYRGDLQVNLGKDQRDFYRLGVYDTGERNRLIAQQGLHSRENWDYRYGVYGGWLGGGVDYTGFSGLTVSLDAYRPNDLSLDLRAKADLGPNWQVILGVDRLWSSNRPILGLKYSR